MMIKHRLAKESYAIDFSAKLSPGETLLNPSVKVTERQSGAWVDVTAQFAPVVAVKGAQVVFTLAVAASSTAQVEQRHGGRLVRRHALLVEADTSEGEHFVGLDSNGGVPKLTVSGDAVPV